MASVEDPIGWNKVYGYMPGETIGYLDYENEYEWEVWMRKFCGAWGWYCCIGVPCCLLLIAAIIALALIPVYISKKIRFI